MCKRAVLVIHGFGGSIIETEKFINYVQLNTNYDVYGFTLPGHDKAIVSNVKYIDWINASIEQVEILLKKYKKIYLVGHSMGGVIASYLATKYKQIKKLVLIAPAFMYVNLKQNQKDIKAMLSKNKLPEEGIYEDLLSKIFRVPITSIFEFMKLAKRYHDTPEYIKCSTLIIHGDEDEIVPISASVYAYDAIKHNKKYITFVRDVKHRVLISDKKELVAEYIIKYFGGGLRWKTVKKSEL